jgi:hypothetical protein
MLDLMGEKLAGVVCKWSHNKRERLIEQFHNGREKNNIRAICICSRRVLTAFVESLISGV